MPTTNCEVFTEDNIVIKKMALQLLETSLVPFYHNFDIFQVKQKFWFWLGVDQLAHVLLNIILAGFLQVVWWLIWNQF